MILVFEEDKWFLQQKTPTGKYHQFHGDLEDQRSRTCFVPQETVDIIKSGVGSRIKPTSLQHLLHRHTNQLFNTQQLRNIYNKCQNAVQIDVSTKQCEISSSATEIMDYLTLEDNISYVAIFHDPASTLLSMTGKGRPSASQKYTIISQDNDGTRAYAYDASITEEDHRRGMLLDGGQSMLLGVVWSTDESIRLTSMFPYTIAVDTTYQTNIEKRPLFVAAGRDTNRRDFQCCYGFLPSERQWVFHWAFAHAMPFLFSHAVMSKIEVIITDADRSMKEAIASLVNDKKSSLYGSVHGLDVWHSLYHPFAKMSTSATTPRGKEYLKEIQNWMLSFYVYVETEDELDISIHNLICFTASFTVSKELGKVLTQQITDFIQGTWYPNKHKYAKCYKMDALYFGQISSNPAEHSNKFIKSEEISTRPTMRLKSAALVISNKTDLKAQSKLQSTKEHIISTPTWSSSTTAEHITKHAEGLIHKEYSLRQNYVSVRKSPFEWCIVAKTSHGVGLEEKPDGANITRFKRLRKVRLFCDGNSYSMSCSCCMPKTHGLPCRHLLYLLGEPKLTMVHVIYLNQYYVKYGVDPKYTSKFDEQRNKHLGQIVIPSEDALELLSYSGTYPVFANSSEYDEIMKLEKLDRPFVTTRMFTGSEHLQSTQMFVNYWLSPKI